MADEKNYYFGLWTKWFRFKICLFLNSVDNAVKGYLKENLVKNENLQILECANKDFKGDFYKQKKFNSNWIGLIRFNRSH